MGNTKSSVWCISPEEIIDTGEDTSKIDASTNRSVDNGTMKVCASPRKEPSNSSTIQVISGFSFSSISSKSSNEDDQQNDFTTTTVEMRNDEPQKCSSMSDELRVAGSSYDEATTEAVDLHYRQNEYSSTRAVHSGHRLRGGGDNHGREY